MSEWADKAATGTKFLEESVIRGLHELTVMSELQSSVVDGDDPLVDTTSPTFAPFEELPKELRVKIWKLALPGPRLVDVCSYGPVEKNSHRSMPSILHVCSESRKEALKWYTALPLGSAPEEYTLLGLRAAYINFQIDTLYFNDYQDDYDDIKGFIKNWVEHGLGIVQVMNNLRFLATTQEVWSTPAHSEQAIRLIRRLRKLEGLTIVMSDDGTDEINREINDEHELEVWDEWQIDKVGVVIRTSNFQISDFKREILEFIKGMTRECRGLKNIKVRIVVVHRAGQKEETRSDSDIDPGEIFPNYGNDIQFDSDDWDKMYFDASTIQDFS